MLVRQLWFILTPPRRTRMVVVVVVAVVAAGAEAGVVLLVEPLISALTPAADTASRGLSDARGELVLFGILVVGKNVLVIGLSWLKNRELFGIQSDVSERLLATYLRGDNPAIAHLDAGEKTSVAITEPLQLVLNGYLPAVTILAESFALIAVVSVLLVRQPFQTLVLLVLVGVGLGVFSGVTRARVIDYGRRRKDSDARRLELVRAILESRVEVSGLGVSAEVLDRYRRPNIESAEMTSRKSFLTEAAKNVLEILVVATVAPLAIVFVYADGTELLALLATFGLAAYRAMPALNRILVSSQSAKFGVATAQTVSDVLRHGEAAPGAVPPADTTPLDGPGECPTLELSFDALRLPNGKEILTGAKVRVSPGEVCVVWGPSGSGKSSVVRALVDGGCGVDVRVDGRHLEHGLSELSGRVGVTAQSPLVLPASLRENFTLGRAASSFDTAAAASLLDDDPQSILDASSITERLEVAVHRHSISGGQAQRISLIRALHESNDIVVLDEPTSALDARSAQALRERVAGRRDLRIFVIATHDPALRALATHVLDVS